MIIIGNSWFMIIINDIDTVFAKTTVLLIWVIDDKKTVILFCLISEIDQTLFIGTSVV